MLFEDLSHVRAFVFSRPQRIARKCLQACRRNESYIDCTDIDCGRVDSWRVDRAHFAPDSRPEFNDPYDPRDQTRTERQG